MVGCSFFSLDRTKVRAFVPGRANLRQGVGDAPQAFRSRERFCATGIEFPAHSFELFAPIWIEREQARGDECIVFAGDARRASQRSTADGRDEFCIRGNNANSEDIRKGDCFGFAKRKVPAFDNPKVSSLAQFLRHFGKVRVPRENGLKVRTARRPSVSLGQCHPGQHSQSENQPLHPKAPILFEGFGADMHGHRARHRHGGVLATHGNNAARRVGKLAGDCNTVGYRNAVDQSLHVGVGALSCFDILDRNIDKRRTVHSHRKAAQVRPRHPRHHRQSQNQTTHFHPFRQSPSHNRSVTWRCCQPDLPLVPSLSDLSLRHRDTVAARVGDARAPHFFVRSSKRVVCWRAGRLSGGRRSKAHRILPCWNSDGVLSPSPVFSWGCAA